MIYLNNAATSYPKPESVLEAINTQLQQPPIETGRGTLDGKEEPLTECRNTIAALFQIENPSRIILTSGSTAALNYAIQGILRPAINGHCITSTQEHNSVLRPLNHLAKNHNLSITYLPVTKILNPDEFEKAFQKNTKLVVLNHVSNVTGTILPLEEIAPKCAQKDVPLIIDASQSSGTIEIDMQRFPDNIILVFTGHKNLLGPMGTGGFYIGPDVDLFEPLLQGGTGVRSDRLFQPDELPVTYEAGTMNLPGFAGLTAGIKYVQNIGVAEIGQQNQNRMRELKKLLDHSNNLKIYEPADNNYSAGIFSFNISGWTPEDVGVVLQDSFKIRCRTGLHCAPLIHREIGSWPRGTVRLSCSCMTQMTEIEKTALALNQIPGQG